MKSLLKPGGYMLHQIDLRDHFNTRQPFNFYQYSEAQWLNLTHRGPFYTNRLRLSDYLKYFTRWNLKVIYQRRKKALVDLKIVKKNLHSDFKSYSNSDLIIEGITLGLKLKKI